MGSSGQPCRYPPSHHVNALQSHLPSIHMIAFQIPFQTPFRATYVTHFNAAYSPCQRASKPPIEYPSKPTIEHLSKPPFKHPWDPLTYRKSWRSMPSNLPGAYLGAFFQNLSGKRMGNKSCIEGNISVYLDQILQCTCLTNERDPALFVL